MSYPRWIFLLLAVLAATIARSERSGDAQHTQVVMRMIGHQLLLQQGDSSSVVLPIENEEDLYKIRFEREFVFDPDAVSAIIDSTLRATNVSANYIVEVRACNGGSVVHAYEVSLLGDVPACQGRTQPEGCYEVWITLRDDFDRSPIAGTDLGSDKVMTSRTNATSMLVIGLVLGGLLTAAWFILLWKPATQITGGPAIRLGNYEFDQKGMKLRMGEMAIELTGKEAELLHVLSTSPNQTIEREEILRTVWGDDGDYIGRTLDVFISKLRKKLEQDSRVRIVNIRGIGYKLVLEG